MTNMRHLMEYLVSQQMPFVVYGDWKMTTQRFQEEVKSWRTEVRPRRMWQQRALDQQSVTRS